MMAIVMMVLIIILTIMIMTTTIRLCCARVGAATGKKELSVVEKFPRGLLQVIVIITYDHDHTYDDKDEGSDDDKFDDKQIISGGKFTSESITCGVDADVEIVNSSIFVGGLSHLPPSSFPETQS